MTLSFNQLAELPETLIHLHLLNELPLAGNPLNPELAAAYEEGLEAVKRYLRAKAEAQAVLNEAKLILIGEGEVGKTCLLGALRGDPWHEDRSTTHGIEIKSVEVTDPTKTREITLKLAVLTHEVKWLVENFWEGLKCQVVVPCIEPCGTSAPGTGFFEVEKLIRSKRPDRPEYPCPVCNEWQNIECLLRNAPVARRPSIELLLTEGFDDMRTRLDELRRQNFVLDQDMKRIMSQVEDAFRGVMRTIADEGKDGQRLFSLEPVDSSQFNPNGWVKKKFRVTLWCEHTHLPLPLLNKNDKEGVYEFDVTREWFATAAPFLKVLTGTLSLVLPVAISSAKLSLGEAAYKGLERQLDFGKSCAEAMLNATGKTAESLIEKDGPEVGRTGAIRAHGGVLREFQTWLKKADPGFGDLRKVLNKQKEFLWVHRDFEEEY